MPKWNVDVSYWSGFTKDREWQEDVRGLLEAQGWTGITFWNGYSEGFAPYSGSVDADEIRFLVSDEKPSREAVEKVLEKAGIQYTAFVRITECEPE